MECCVHVWGRRHAQDEQCLKIMNCAPGPRAPMSIERNGTPHPPCHSVRIAGDQGSILCKRVSLLQYFL